LDEKKELIITGREIDREREREREWKNRIK
jgi:hypothetical protein